MVLIAAALFAAAPAYAEVPSGQPVHGIRCEAMEGNVMHIHQHVAIFNHGKPVAIPPDVGQVMIGSCLFWLHTHTPDGIVHIESPAFRTFTLGDFFDVWGEPLSRTNVAGAKPRGDETTTVWVDGHRYAGDPRKIELTQHLDVTIDVGPPARQPAPFTAWNGN
jgi:hypothetical protein